MINQQAAEPSLGWQNTVARAIIATAAAISGGCLFGLSLASLSGLDAFCSPRLLHSALSFIGL
jgi:hypothetical protein